MSCCLLYCYKDAILCNMTTRYTIPPSQEKAIKVPATNPFLSAPKLALTSYPSPDPVKHERQRYHQHRQPRQQPRCADRSQPVIHLVGKQRETCCEGRSQCRVAGHGARRDRSICAATVTDGLHPNQHLHFPSVSFRNVFSTLETHSTRYVKTLVNTHTIPIPKKTVPRMGMIQGTDLYVVNVKMNMPIGVTSAPAMPISNRASGGAFPPFLADSLW
jgi:hypothetical protein